MREAMWVLVSVSKVGDRIESATAVVECGGVECFRDVCVDPKRLDRVVRARALEYGISRIECETLASDTARQIKRLLEGS